MNDAGGVMVEIGLDKLEAHPKNSNTMRRRMVDLLKRHLEEHDQYPPVIVRPLGGDEGRYQILDGHHRVMVLRELGREVVRCVVWAVDDARALVLLATLNRLRGADSPVKRGELLEELTRHVPMVKVAPLLPEDRGVAERLIGLTKERPTLVPAHRAEDRVVAVHFFLKPAERKRLDRVLRALGGSRSEALVELVNRYEADKGAV
ncbi:MAG: ParB/RepB/Spo0J family partition protein [Phycisphaeraceae bacterium]